MGYGVLPSADFNTRIVLAPIECSLAREAAIRALAIALLIGMLLATQGCGKAIESSQSDGTEDIVSSIDVTVHPPELVGIWTWQWTLVGDVDHVVLHADGTAEKFQDRKLVNANGAWQLESPGMMLVQFPDADYEIEFRIDEDGLMDMSTLGTGRDLPWHKARRLSSSLDNQDLYPRSSSR